MPTGVALRDARNQLLAAGEQVLLRGGPTALSSRTVTEEANVSKGVLHRYFADFDDFLVTLVRTRAATVDAVSTGLLDQVGRGTVTANLCAALIQLFDPLGLAVIRLALSRDELRIRLREESGRSLPILSEAVDGLAAYLEREQGAGRLVADAAPAGLAQALIGTGHLLFAGELGGLPDESAVYEVVEAIIVGAEPGIDHA